eukprot:GHVU01123351.1.p1 GENE.GHVU01123351.1~~GHVU01123351.1.p1  ORF type:complete len:181 (-),score=34.44 GHVU01123351.1:586-1128(-)
MLGGADDAAPCVQCQSLSVAWYHETESYVCRVCGAEQDAEGQLARDEEDEDKAYTSRREVLVPGQGLSSQTPSRPTGPESLLPPSFADAAAAATRGGGGADDGAAAGAHAAWGGTGCSRMDPRVPWAPPDEALHEFPSEADFLRGLQMMLQRMVLQLCYKFGLSPAVEVEAQRVREGERE